jgi:hypothetical protein
MGRGEGGGWGEMVERRRRLMWRACTAEENRGRWTRGGWERAKEKKGCRNG